MRVLANVGKGRKRDRERKREEGKGRKGRKAISPEPEAGTPTGGASISIDGRRRATSASGSSTLPWFFVSPADCSDIYFHCRSCQRYLDIYRGALGRRKSWTIARWIRTNRYAGQYFSYVHTICPRMRIRFLTRVAEFKAGKIRFARQHRYFIQGFLFPRK